MAQQRSSRDKHSFIQFYFDDWKAGTAHMTRLVRSIYFDICLYNWDKRRPVPPSTLAMMTADIEDAGKIINALIDDASLVADSNGAVHSPRALREGERAFGAWEGKSRGGKGSKSVDDCGSNEQSSEDTSEVSSEHSSEVSSTEPDSDSDSEPDKVKMAHLAQADVLEAWNETARRNGLAQVIKVTDERGKRLRARIAEHGAEAIIAGIKSIPSFPFLLGKGGGAWKANFDWLLQPKSCAKLLEGGYSEGAGKMSGWTE